VQPRLDRLYLGSLIRALGGGLPIKKTQLGSLPLGSLTKALGGGLPVNERREASSISPIPVVKGRQLDALMGLLSGKKAAPGNATAPVSGVKE
jgi:hypothetical protein